MTLLVLVHGAWHSGSSWEPVVKELAARGRAAVTPDLPADRPGSTLLDYAAAVEEAIEAAAPRGSGERVLLVGHSLGGLTVPVVAQRLGPECVAGMVFVAALLPREGVSFRDQMRADPGLMVEGSGAGLVRHADGTTSWPADVAPGGLYRGVAAESSGAEVAAAVAGMRPQGSEVNRDPSPLTVWPDVSTTVVVCTDDLVVAPDRQRSRAATLPRTEVVELPGGHFPMLTRPAQLADLLDGIAARV